MIGRGEKNMRKACNSRIYSRFYSIIALVICCVMVLGLIGPIKANAAEKTKRYIVLTVDTSGSSDFYNSDFTELLYSASSPMTEVKNAATKFAESLADSEDDVYVSVISYGDTARLVSGFTNDIASIKRSINNLSSVGGGKNMGAALKMADSQLSEITNSAAMKSVVLVSPGMCNTGEYSYTGHWNGNVVGGEALLGQLIIRNCVLHGFRVRTRITPKAIHEYIIRTEEESSGLIALLT